MGAKSGDVWPGEPKAYAIDFMVNPDRLQIGAGMRTQRLAMVAFADLLSTACM